MCEGKIPCREKRVTPAKRSRCLTALTLSGLFLLGEVIPAHGAELTRSLSGQRGFCNAPLTPPPLGDPDLRDAPNTPLQITAGMARYNIDSEEYLLLGRPVITRADQRLKANRIYYNARTGRIEATGDVFYQQYGLVIRGKRGHFNLQTNTGVFHQLRYRIEQGHIHGAAARVRIINPNRTTYQDARFTTCKPGEEDWWLHSGSLTIDEAKNIAYARNVWLSFHGVPFAYTPFISFPVGVERKTGFLMPTIGTSSTGGFQLAIPWYWNIAPNYDATFTPTLYTKRGVQLGIEFRYLLPTLRGRSRFEYLPNDWAFGEARWLLDLNHDLQIGQHLQAHLDVNRVSDNQYLDDFGSNLDESTASALPSRLGVTVSFDDWGLSAQARTWQTIAPNFGPRDKPFSALPRIRFSYSPYWGEFPLQFQLQAEAVRFQHPHPDLVDTGYRFDIMPELRLPFRTLGYFIEPRIAYRYTTYRLDRADPSLPENPSRGLPIASVDAGVFLERELNLFGKTLTQTLEPRLFYLYVPERDQENLPVFDTSRATFTFHQLFATNRFTGPDRMGDANQLTAAVTSRVLSKTTGFEYLRFSVGRIFYFSDREVTLPGRSEESSDSSDYITKLHAGLPGLMSLSVNYRWNPGGTNNQRLTARLQIRGGNERVFNLAYRMQERNGRKVLAGAEGSFGLALGGNWHIVGGWNYSFLDDRTQARFFGLEFNSCCYAIRVLFRQFQADPESASANLQTGFLLQFQLRGLGAVGHDVRKFIRGAIPGFRPTS